jgi:hypothetical protein
MSLSPEGEVAIGQGVRPYGYDVRRAIFFSHPKSRPLGGTSNPPNPPILGGISSRDTFFYFLELVREGLFEDTSHHVIETERVDFGGPSSLTECLCLPACHSEIPS